MTDLLKTGVAWLGGQLQAHASRTINYVRGASTITAIAATRGRTEYETTDEEGNVTTSHTDLDWIVDAALLVLDGSALEPRSGDRIIETVGAVTHTYEVMPQAGLQCFSMEPTGTLYRIHTKHVDP
jgi:hypothetical protein